MSSSSTTSRLARTAERWIVAGIRSLEDAETVLNLGADKISINSPALENPKLVETLARRFGSQCVVVGVDSSSEDDDYWVYQYTGNPDQSRSSQRRTVDWIREVQERGAGEIVLNCMNQDGVRRGYDLPQLKRVRDLCRVPLIASGGAGEMEHFKTVFDDADVDGALAASVFHAASIRIPDLKNFLIDAGVAMRLPGQ